MYPNLLLIIFKTENMHRETTKPFNLPGFRKALILTVAIAGMLLMEACSKEHSTSTMDSSNFVSLKTGMRMLWSDHMQWTYSTVDAFFHEPEQLNAKLNRLLQNQKDIGAAIVPYYGQAAGDQLAQLLTTHIQQAVPVLNAAKAGDQAALDKALADWYANAQEIADFLAGANPKYWEKPEMESMMKEHISTTVTYSVDLLKGEFEQSIIDYEKAAAHMTMMADMLSEGIAKQFPNKF